MAYLALARKWRPKSFQEVVGQEHVVKALSNALDSGRVHHAYLFTGTRGVGKTTLARIFAKSLNCETGTSAEPCQQCSTCISVDEGRFVDLIEVDAASRTKVDDTRELLENVQYAPTVGKFKVYLIDEVHMLSGHSFNALLKTLEEPPAHVKFLFATTDPQKMPVTVLSRCLQFNLRAMRPEQVENQLIKILDSEGLDYELPAIQALAKAADGSMRDGLSLLDQAIAQSEAGITQQDIAAMLGTIKSEHIDALMQGLSSNDPDQVMHVVSEMAEHAVDFSTALDDLLVRLYNTSLMQVAPSAAEAKGLDLNTLRAEAEHLSAEQTQLYYQIGLLGKRDLTLAPSLRVGFEMALLRMMLFDPSSGGDPVASDAPTHVARESSGRDVNAMQAASTDKVVEQIAESDGQQNHDHGDQRQPSARKPLAARTAPSADQQAPSAGQQAPSATQTEPSALQAAEAQPEHAPQGEGGREKNSAVMAALVAHNEWGALVEQSELMGMTRQLAMNCACERLQEDRIELALSPRLQHLNKPERVEEITAEMKRVQGRSITVELTLEDSEKETPAECLQRLGIERTSQLRADIEQQPGVKALMSEFGATIVEQSVKPIDS